MILGIVFIGIPLYFLPTIIAVARHKDNKLVVFLINLFLGWSLIGWIIALIFSLSNGPEKSKIDQTVVVSQNVDAQQKDSSYLDIAKERYAKGEISKEEFEQIKRDLS
ncbi:superinfection immunity protein [Chloroflexota bacterium]